MTGYEYRIIPTRAFGTVYAECDVKIATAWSIERLIEDGTWDSTDIIPFYDEEHKWEVLQDARKMVFEYQSG